jgi:hypothetical protein
MKPKLILVATILVQAAVLAASQPIQLNVKELPQYGVHLLASPDPAFEGCVMGLLGGATDPVLDAVKPYSVILKNESGTDIIAFALRWLWTDATGRTTFHDVFFHNLGSPTNSSYRLASGSNAFVSLHFAFVKYTRAFRLSRSETVDLNRMLQQSAITISLDGVVFADGRYVGPDETRAYSKALAVTQDERGLMTEVVSRYRSNQSDADITSWLTAIANTSSQTASSILSVDLRQVHQRQMAQMLLDQHAKRGSDKVLAIASKRIGVQDLTIVRVKFNAN